MRRALVLAAASAMVAFAGCVGDTDEATHVRATQAQFNAHGHTNNGPAYWWWEYSTIRSLLENGLGVSTPHYGPASSSQDVKLSGGPVAPLFRNTPYYYRACGQDQKAGSQPICGKIKTFTTLNGDSSVKIVKSDPPFYLEYRADAYGRNNLNISEASAGISFTEFRFDDGHYPPYGTSVIAGAGCSNTVANQALDQSATCDPGVAWVYAYGGSYDDHITTSDTFRYPVLFYGQDGNDNMVGGTKDDYMSGGTGNDSLNGGLGNDHLDGFQGNDSINAGTGQDVVYGGDGDDTIIGGDDGDSLHGGPGNDSFDCGPGYDTIYIGNISEFTQSTECEVYQYGD